MLLVPLAGNLHETFAKCGGWMRDETAKNNIYLGSSLLQMDWKHRSEINFTVLHTAVKWTLLWLWRRIATSFDFFAFCLHFRSWFAAIHISSESIAIFFSPRFKCKCALSWLHIIVIVSPQITILMQTVKVSPFNFEYHQRITNWYCNELDLGER